MPTFFGTGDSKEGTPLMATSAAPKEIKHIEVKEAMDIEAVINASAQAARIIIKKIDDRNADPSGSAEKRRVRDQLKADLQTILDRIETSRDSCSAIFCFNRLYTGYFNTLFTRIDKAHKSYKEEEDTSSRLFRLSARSPLSTELAEAVNKMTALQASLEAHERSNRSWFSCLGL